MRHALVVLFTLGLTAAGAVAREGSRYASLSLEELLTLRVDAATRTEVTQLETPQAVTVVTRAEIERSPATNLTELLQWATGVNAVRVHSSQNMLSGRGSNIFTPAKILVLIDGQAIDPTIFSTTWWDLLPISIHDVEKLEWIRSPGTIYGANAQNGVLNIVTRVGDGGRVGDRPRGQVTIRAGEQSLAQGYLGVSGSRGQLDYRVSAETTEIDAFETSRPLVPGQAGPGGEQTFDASREQLDVRTFSGLLRTEIGAGRLDLQTGYKAIANAQGRVPDRLCFVGLEGSTFFSLARYAVERSRVRHELYLSVDRNNFGFKRNNDASCGSPEALRPAEMTLSKTAIGYETRFSPNDDHTLLVGLRYALETASDEGAEPFFRETSVSDQETLELHVQDDWRLSPKDRLYVGALVSEHYVSGSRVAPMLAYVHKLNDRNSLRLGTFTSYRHPNVFEHSIDYDQASGSPGKQTRILPNLGLDPERTTSYEMGYRGKPLPDLFLAADLFLNEVSDGIEWSLVGTEGGAVPRPQYTSRNTLEQRVAGVETTVRYHLGHAWSLEANWTLQEVTNTSADPAYRGPGGGGVNGVGEGRYGEQYLPPTIVNAILDYRRGRFTGRLHARRAASHTWQWPSWNVASEADALKLKPVPAHTVVNLHLGVDLLESVTLAIEGQNLFDELHTEWRADKGFFGRLLWAKLDVRF